MADDGDLWHAAGHSLGLRPFLSCARFAEGDSFRQVMARLGMEATRPRSLEHVLAGAVEDVRVLLVCYSTPNRFGMPASSLGTKGYSFWTAVIAEIDPNLEAGFHAERETSFSFFLGQDMQIGVPVLDKALRVRALDIQRLHQLFAPRDAADQVFVDNVGVAARRGLFINDTMIGYKLEGWVTDAIRLKATLLDALHMRRQLVRRAERVPQAPYAAELRRNWARFAESANLAFDAARVSLSGVVRGVPIEVLQEGAPGRFQLAVRCRFPQPIPAQVRLSKMRRLAAHEIEPPSFMLPAAGLEDVVVGDADFDRAFHIQGYPVEPVRAAFHSPGFRTQLMAVARVASHLELTHDGASWFIPRPAQSAAELTDHVEMAVRVARSREPREEESGPYR